MKQYIMSIDQGTTSSRAILFDLYGNIISSSQREIKMIYQQEGYVEQDAYEIWTSVLSVMADCLLQKEISPKEVLSIGITNQRETTIMWNKKTGLPIYKAIVWQSKQSSEICDQLKRENKNTFIRQRTGLLIDPYFSGSKVKWIIDHVDGAKALMDNNELAFGTVDSWLLYKLTGGTVHKTDHTNASRTLLYNIYTKEWDQGLCDLFGIKQNILPEVCSSNSIFGYTDETTFFGENVPISGVLGDQQAALFGQRCFALGQMKNTYGTGCFMLMNTGDTPHQSDSGLLTTIGYSIDNKVNYALEGSVFIAGSAIQWLRDDLDFFEDSSDSEEFANRVKDSEKVVVVPSFSGLGTPYWDSRVKGAMFGLTRSTNKYHITRATLEALAFQTKDIIEAMIRDSNIPPTSLNVDGGASNNNYLMQFQSDILNIPINRPIVFESTALGAMLMSGIGIKAFTLDDIKDIPIQYTHFSPKMNEEERKERYNRWNKAIKAVLLYT